ncbi:MAG: hypothetical protein ACJ71U_12965 [Terriglobales bacterium]
MEQLNVNRVKGLKREFMFDIATCTDFYAILVQDFDDYMSETHSARKAAHCAISAYHLREWVWKDWLVQDISAQNAIGVHDQESFNAWVNRSCVWFRLLRELTNGTKHFTNKANFQTIRVTAAPFAWGQVTAGWGEGAWDGPIRYVQSSIPVGFHGQGYLILDLGEAAGDHRWVPAANLIEVVVRFWRDFFKMFRPTVTLRHSKHHTF